VRREKEIFDLIQGGCGRPLRVAIYCCAKDGAPPLIRSGLADGAETLSQGIGPEGGRPPRKRRGTQDARRCRGEAKAVGVEWGRRRPVKPGRPISQARLAGDLGALLCGVEPRALQSAGARRRAPGLKPEHFNTDVSQV
jgi:hypothetical protein